MYSSASLSLSTGRIPDDCTVDTSSSQGARVSKASSRTKLARERYHRRDSSRNLRDRDRGRSTSASNQPASFEDTSAGVLSKNLPTEQSELTPDSDYQTLDENVRAGLRGSHSNPAVPQTTAAKKVVGGNGGHAGYEDEERVVDRDNGIMDLDMPPAPEHISGNESNHEPPLDQYPSVSSKGPSSESQDSEIPPMFKQFDTNAITEDQLINEVRMIYAGLVMVEKKCIEVDKQQTESKDELSGTQWQALISLHRTLLYEHHDFFLASQHPSASSVLRLLAEKYAMPARMWRYGIHSFLELLRQKLPGSLDYMLNFIYLAYSMMTLLLESVPAFHETWIECLGDLARYRMAVEESDMRDREVWAGVSRYWYNQDADHSPEVGRIQHHLAVLARPDVLQQLFHYTKALVSVRPFHNARESVDLLFSPYNGQQQALNQHTMVTAFIATHSALFNEWPADQFITLANHFLILLREEARNLGRQGQTGVYIMSCNFASILQYGDSEAFMTLKLSQKKYESAAEAYESALNWTPGLDMDLEAKSKEGGEPTDASGHLPLMASQGTSLAFHTLSVLLDHLDKPTIYPSAHISLSFIWSLALHPLAMQEVDKFIPWVNITRFLNSLIDSGIDFNKIEDNAFPLDENETLRQLPEDFLIRGQSWSTLYFPETFFEGAPSEDDRPIVEPDSTAIPRKHRCLWLGVRLATVCSNFSLVLAWQKSVIVTRNEANRFDMQFGRWMIYNNRRFESTQRALMNAATAETCGGLNSNTPGPGPSFG
ncbi:DNA/RNA-binding domain E.t1.c1-type [Penicillium cataractarum]|uniref:DNA/RNA-binding domain E.t1.c1-type n=1 Tax=Penicillium cataractarum TaxID=2100454 RepID=A0A9W9VI40_9EURO|nr:DNA/RNA-binding domain E.t1.c1-type [Penicillium cataractarum]KAJ5381594.1 DNA/RNA-binding domain E.t1.c1-type [Penicillium cataractarum]